MKTYAAVLTATLAIAAAVAPAPANAAGTLYIAGNATADCKGSSGPSAMAFYFPSQYMENTTGGTQYITCHYPAISDFTQPYTTNGTTGYSLTMRLRNMQGVPADFTCVAEVGYEGMTASNFTTVVKTVTVGASTWANMGFSNAELPIKGGGSYLAINCAIPAGGRVSWIDVMQPKNF